MLGENIKKIRIEKGLTQKELADKVGISGAFMSLIEKGANNPSDENLKKISDVLNVSVDDLKTRETETPTIELISLLIKLTEKNKIKWENMSPFNKNISEFNTTIKSVPYSLAFDFPRDKSVHNIFDASLIIGTNDIIVPKNESEYRVFEELYHAINSYLNYGEQVFKSIGDLKSLLDE